MHTGFEDNMKVYSILLIIFHVDYKLKYFGYMELNKTLLKSVSSVPVLGWLLKSMKFWMWLI
jgi:hypothetical protein